MLEDVGKVKVGPLDRGLFGANSTFSHTWYIMYGQVFDATAVTCTCHQHQEAHILVLTYTGLIKLPIGF